MISFIKNLFKKEPKIDYVIFDGKEMKYLSLTQSEIEKLKNDSKSKNWVITKKEDC